MECQIRQKYYFTADKRPHEVSYRPGERMAGTTAAIHPRVNFFEPTEQPAVAIGGEAGEVVGLLVDLLHERGLRVDHSVELQYPPNFVHNNLWFNHMFQHCRDPD